MVSERLDGWSLTKAETPEPSSWPKVLGFGDGFARRLLNELRSAGAIAEGAYRAGRWGYGVQFEISRELWLALRREARSFDSPFEMATSPRWVVCVATCLIAAFPSEQTSPDGWDESVGTAPDAER